CILKHSSPCGIAVFPRLIDAYKRAKSCDPISSFGGIVGVNREVSGELAKELSSTFIEAVLAPSYNEEAKNILSKKKRLILLKLPLDCSLSTVSYRYINGGLIRQDSDNSLDNIKDYKVVSKRKPTKRELNAMNFAFNVVKFIKSNAVCITTDRMTVGIGGGQPNRVGALEIAIRNRKIFGFKDGIALASDGFFPFRDSIDLAAKEGIKAIIEPGGSIRDEEVIKAADEHNISLIFTGRRHFRH
ncbi:bifunctional phosphoribosylaminoimidazolecarboxamide formyltransferase/IMP cyclohydrolase, partial [candidate division WOR-3 bacterium]|nr:bifunctional phosphoribosylaminoimidazolecarboxamide formyltransferase/IMP cyclohydrolase [candidate division WOR-3 bacterium]